MRTTGPQGDSLALSPESLILSSAVVQLTSGKGKRKLTVHSDAAALTGWHALPRRSPRHL